MICNSSKLADVENADLKKREIWPVVNLVYPAYLQLAQRNGKIQEMERAY